MEAQDRMAADDVLEASEDKLQKKLYVIFTRPTSGLTPIMEKLEEHLAYQQELEEQGIIFGAGPFWTDDEQYWEGGGMIIVRADSMEEAREIAEADPMHQSGAREYTVRPWLLNEGSLSVRLDFTDREFSLE